MALALLSLGTNAVKAQSANGAPSSLPPVTIDAPAKRTRPPAPIAKRPARTSVAGAKRQKARVRVVTRPAPVAPTAPTAAPSLHQTLGTNSTIGAPPPAYTGGQVARGGRLGLLGNRDYMSTPFSQNSYTDKLIKDQQARTVADVLLDDPSVRPTVSPFGYQDNFSIRGFILNGRDFAFDGLYGVTNNRRPELTGVERVDVLHGPGAFLYGFPPTGTIAGVVNLVPKRAGDKPLTEVSLDYFSRGNVNGAFDVARRFGDMNQLGVRLNGSYQDGRTPIDFQTFQHGAFTGGVDWQGDRFRASIDFGATHLGYDSPSPNIQVRPGFAIPKAPSLTQNLAQPFDYVHTNYVFGTTRLEYDLAPHLTAFGSFGASSIDERFMQTLPTITDATGNLSTTLGHAGGQEIQKTTELGIRGAFDTGSIHHAASIAGTGYWQEYPFSSFSGNPGQSNLYNPVYTTQPAFSSIVPTPFDPSSEALYGVAAADTMTLFDGKLDLTGGVRHQWLTNRSYSNATPSLVTYYDKQAVTPLGAVVIRPIKQLSLYASYAEGLGNGPTAPATALNAGQMFPPTVAKQIETGFKVDLDRVGFSAALFQVQQQSSFTDPTTNIFGVTGQQVNRGVELNVFGSPIEGVRTIGGVQFIRGTMTKTVGGQYDGNEAPAVPNIQVSFSGEYDLPFLTGLTATGRVIYTDSQIYDLANTQSIPAWTRFDLGARYALNLAGKDVVARFSVENVAGINYYASAGNGSLALGTPRTYKLSLSTKF